jgi:uncharacterized protein
LHFTSYPCYYSLAVCKLSRQATHFIYAQHRNPVPHIRPGPVDKPGAKQILIARFRSATKHRIVAWSYVMLRVLHSTIHLIPKIMLQHMYIVSLYSGIFGLFFVALSVRTLLLRRQFGIAIGSADNPMLARASRVHANFAEYIPFALVLIYLLETQTSSNWWIHIICLALLIGRISHAYGVSQVKENLRYRVIGMALTFMVIISTSIRLLIAYIQSVV